VRRTNKFFPKKKVYNVYGEEINPDNLMPINPNQLPVPGQTIPLSTNRANSNIPKGGTDSDTWTYPSPQMFYSALSRKAKLEGIQEEDVETVVSIHNNMNEHTWNEVMRWEKKYSSEVCPVLLLKFRGRPYTLSPTARVKHWFGSELPFDRHDWIIDRCGREVRYVIDYYYKDPNMVKQTPGSNITVHVRPALDSFSSGYDRFMARIGRILGTHDRVGGYSSPPPVQQPTTLSIATLEPTSLSDDEFKFLSTLTLERTDQIKSEIESKCGQLIQMSLDPTVPTNILPAINICIGRIICPTYTQPLEQLLDQKNLFN